MGIGTVGTECDIRAVGLQRMGGDGDAQHWQRPLCHMGP